MWRTWISGAAVAALAFAQPASAHPSRGIVVAADGTVFFSDRLRVRSISPKGKVRVVRMNFAAENHVLALAADGAIWGEEASYDAAGRLGRQSVWRMLPDGSLTYRYGPRDGAPPQGLGVLRDHRGCTWHAAEVKGRAVVDRHCPGKAAERLFGAASATPEPIVRDIGGSALGADGSFVFRQGGTLRKIAPGGAAILLARGLAKGNYGIALGPQDKVFVAERERRRVIEVRWSRRTVLRSAAPWAPTGVFWRAGALYVLEASDHEPGKRPRMRVRKVIAGAAPVTLATVWAD